VISPTLDYITVHTVLDGNMIRATPLFNCHFCGAKNPVQRSFSVNLQKDINFNPSTPTIFTLPCCGNQVELWVAVHKTKGLNNLACCTKRTDAEGTSGIPADWWVETGT